jgi:EAL domain-containing protein (putative c-di-GMP-specific phosphodiesterase class I)/CheY-like chemotaxis protein/GGDEF domain-containing protein
MVDHQLGQEMGDALLVEVARRIERVFRRRERAVSLGLSDRRAASLARFAGDQFALVTASGDGQGPVDRLADQIAEALRRHPVLEAGGVAITASIGVALAPPGAVSVDRLVRNVEVALRRAKVDEPGGYRVITDDPDGPDGADAGDIAGEQERALRRALDRGELRLDYQPKIALDSDRVIGVEALLRWDDPVRGTVPPLDFIPLAEESGLILPIGAWVIEEACRQAHHWLMAFPARPPLTVSVNVSVRQFGPELVAIVADALAASAIPAEMLFIEVTESILMADIDGALCTLSALADLGVLVSLDDFGTGYSSLSYLKLFRLHELKIDKSFIDGLGNDPHDTAIVAAVISIAHALGLDVVAEGVEKVAQLERLRTLGCDQGQGYYFARPAGAATIDDLLRSEMVEMPLTDPGLVEVSGYRPHRLLVIDDNEEIRRLAGIIMAAQGFDVHQAVDGESGLATAQLIAPDCILLDLVMPGIGGIEVCAALRSDPRTANCTILMLTATDDAAEKVRAFSCGADDYIVKPFSPRDLVSRVNAALRRRRPQGADVDAGLSFSTAG